ncbi:MAG: bifunctional adenosylcobinamide kinase/adenosylcobinamide-phosphate guanylyltransferase [Alphaproteobacteria bacterium]|nr:bifunctional adenosylcobinamide kinase/adenosylcobinamide-phosphate guanylyltransferase [Alphaproteobacteria bacterium]
MALPSLTLVLGGARSGKSRFAESLAARHPGPRIYIATAEPLDEEMAERIARHRADRAGASWSVVEEPRDLASALRRAARPEAVLLVDCLTLWLANLMTAGDDIDGAESALKAALAICPGKAILVANEVGLGIVPDNALARAFRDRAGRLNQALASAADAVYFVAAGLPLALKGPSAQ